MFWSAFRFLQSSVTRLTWVTSRLLGFFKRLSVWKKCTIYLQWLVTHNLSTAKKAINFRLSYFIFTTQRFYPQFCLDFICCFLLQQTQRTIFRYFSNSQLSDVDELEDERLVAVIKNHEDFTETTFQASLQTVKCTENNILSLSVSFVAIKTFFARFRKIVKIDVF